MDEYALGREVERQFADAARRMDGMDARLTKLAADAVMTNVWQMENSHVRDLIANADARSKERHGEVLEAIKEVRDGISKRSEWTWTRVIGVSGVLAVIAAAWITAVMTSKGIK